MGIKVRHNGQWVEMGFAGAPGGEPIGTIIAWGGSTANIPSNFRLCDGQALSRTTYSELFSKLGIIHGSGDGSTTFNIPDLRDKFIVGAENTTSTTYPGLTVGVTGGSANAVVPAHDHPDSFSITSNKFAYRVADGSGGDDIGTSSNNISYSKPTLSGGVGTRGVDASGTVNNAQSATNANLPPYYALCYIIKIDISSATGSGVADGDYGDITVSNSGTVWNIDPDTIGPTELISTGVSAGSYTNANISVDVDGRITAASNGSTPVTTFLGLSDTPSTYVGSAGRVLVVNNTQNGVEFVDKSAITSGFSTDKISEADSKAEIIDTATESKFTVEIDATEKFSVDIGGPKIHRQDNSNEGGSIVLNRAADDVAAFELDVYGPSSSDSGRFRIIDSTGGGERFAIGPNGEIGLGYVSATSADYGTAGQVLTSGGPGVGATWANASGGGGSSDPVGTIVAWAGSVASIPSEYQLCDGLEAATSELAAITGTYVPDLRSRFIVGAHDVTGEGTWPNVGVGSTGGNSESTLPSHRHIYPGDDHLAFANNKAGWTGGVNNPNTYADTFGMDADSGSSGAGRMWYTTYAGSTDTNTNLPPYYALCYIIKHTATSGSGSGSGSGGGITLLPAQTAAQATSVEFTDIPADALEITVMFEGVSLSGTNNFDIQLGTSSGYIVSNYDSLAQDESGGNEKTSISSFVIPSGAGNEIRIGSMLIKKASSTSYVQTGQFSVGPHTGPSAIKGGTQTYGSLSSVSGTVDRLRIKPNGTNTFDAGSISVSYKTSGSGGGAAAGDKISEGNTEAEVVDTGSNGHFKVTTEGTERLRITSNGSVGIGTTNPEGSQNSNPLFATKLDVFKSFVGGGDRSFVGRFYGLDTNVQETSVRFITKGTGGTTADLHNASDAYLMHGISNGDTKFVFGANGNVGIGTTNPNVAVDSTNTAKLAVGIVTCNELYVNGTQITGSGSGSSSGNNQTWLANWQSVQSEPGNSVEWTGIPQDTQRIIIMFYDVSPGSSQDWLVQLGNTSGNWFAGAYESASTTQGGTVRYDTEGFIINVTSNNAICSGRMVIERFSPDNTRRWVATGQITHGTGGGMRQFAGSFSSYTSSVIDRIRFITENYSSNNPGRCFDSGYISILCEGPGGGGSSGGGGTVSLGTFTATAGSPSTLESYTYDSAELVFEYTVFVKNGSNYQTQKLLVMRDGTTVDSSQYAVMYSNNLLVQLDATISGSNLLLRATPETGVSGSTTYRIKREVI